MAIYQEEEIRDLPLKFTPVGSDEIELQETGGGLSKRTTLSTLITNREAPNGVAGLDANSEVIKPQAGAAARIAAGAGSDVKRADGTWGLSQAGYRGAVVFSGAPFASFVVPDSILTIVPFTTEGIDTDSIHDNAINNTRLTVPAGVSKVRLRFTVSFFVVGGGRRFCTVLKNGININYLNASETIPTATAQEFLNMTSPIMDVVAGDFFELQVLQISGASMIIFGTPSAPLSFLEMEILE